jgi:hypothetical protein
LPEGWGAAQFLEQNSFPGMASHEQEGWAHFFPFAVAVDIFLLSDTQEVEHFSFLILSSFPISRALFDNCR